MSQRLSRWSDEPRIRNGQVLAVKPSKRESAILFPLLQRYPALPVNYIHALMGENGGNLDYLADRLPILACKPNCYLHRHRAQRRNADGNYRYQIYSHADVPLSHFWHDVLCSMVMTHVEIGAKHEGMDYARFDRILAKAPALPKGLPTREADRPGTIVIQFQPPTGRARKVSITPDWTPFALGRAGKFKFYVGIEADCHSETIKSGHLHRSSIRRKLLEYLAVHEQKVAQTVYGLPTPFYFPFVFDLESRVENAKQLLFEITEGEGSPYFLFNHFPSYNSHETPPKPDGAFFRATWRRAWETDFHMNE